MRGFGMMLALAVTLAFPMMMIFAAEAEPASGDGGGISNFILLIGVGAVIVVGLVAARRNNGKD